MLIRGYCHCLSNEAGQIISEQQMARIERSGLLGATQSITAGIVGSFETQFDHFYIPDRKSTAYHHHQRQVCEYFTLQMLWRDAHTVDECLYWYIHTKGASWTSGREDDPWRESMEACVIDGWKSCVQILTGTTKGCCGPLLNCNPHPFFAGNFWWAKASHIRRLCSPLELLAERKSRGLRPDLDRFIAEEWITQGVTGRSVEQELADIFAFSRWKDAAAMDSFPPPRSIDPRELYLDMIKRSLINWIYKEQDRNTGGLPPGSYPISDKERLDGLVWSNFAHTMIGLTGLNNVQACVEAVIADQIPGDFIETGVWRGGACILMAAMLKAYGIADRRVWVADSFAGLPAPDLDKYPQDAGLNLQDYPQLAISVDEVKENFRRYNLLDEQVQFLVGWFRDTLPKAPIKQLAILRLDGDMYEATIQALDSLYDKVSLGGFVIVDDYECVGACKQAILDFRVRRSITDPMIPMDLLRVYWRKTA